MQLLCQAIMIPGEWFLNSMIIAITIMKTTVRKQLLVNMWVTND